MGSTRPASALTLHERGEGFVVSSWGSVFVTGIFGQPSDAMLDAIDRHEGALTKKHPDGITSIFVIHDVQLARPPTAEFKKASQALMEKYAPHLRGTAQVVIGGGFVASMIRTFITAVTMFGSSPVRTKAFASVGDAVRWMVQLPGQDPEIARTAAMLEAALTEMR